MLYLNHTYEVLTGGFYSGNSLWNKKNTEIDQCFKLYQLTDGEVFIDDEHQSFRLHPGHLYLINGHKLRQQYCQTPFSTYWLHFTPQELTIYQGMLSLPAVLSFPDSLIPFPHLITMTESQSASVSNSEWHLLLDRLYFQTQLQIITWEAFKQYPLPIQKPSSQLFLIEPALKYIKTHYKEGLTLTDLSDLCHMSPSHFHRVFKKSLNISPKQYLHHLRMHTALQLLSAEKHTIKSIAYELGFTDDAHFSKSFKKCYGISPGEYQSKKKNILP